MGRPTRFKLPGIPQLISQRGHNRLPCFLDGSDYQEFKNILKESAQLASCDISALLMLPGAYWVLARPDDKSGIAQMIQRTGRCYVRYCNEKYRREGTLWASRYRACLVEPSADIIANCLNFLHHMPARAQVVPEGSPWPWFFVEGATEQSVAELDEAVFETISSMLDKGLVYGSGAFRKRISEQEGIRTEPGVRGRPRKTANA